jgi:serine/threonine-protein kinase
MTWRLAEYTEIGRIGAGATGTVVSARHDRTGTFVAIKFLSARGHRNSTPSEWFRSQVQLLSEIDAPNVARLYEYVEGPRGGALVMELVDGVSLDHLIRRGPLEPPAALALFKGCLRGLAAAHAKGLLHRDFRPASVQVGRGGATKIVDFGVVPPVDSMHPGAGTPLYQAPELWDRKPADERTDIYAATATFFECLTGHPPFPPTNTMAEMREAHESAPIPLDEVPEPLRDIVGRGLAKDPERRPTDASSFLRSVEQVSARRYGSDWERAGESALFKRLVPVASPAGTSARSKPPRVATALFASTFATRLLAGAALVVAIIIGVASGVTAEGASVNTGSGDQPGFTVVLPNGETSGGPSGRPTAIPSLLVIPTPGVTLTAPPARVGGAGGGVIGAPTLAPPPGQTGKPTGKPSPGGGSTTGGNPSPTPTAAPPDQVVSATLVSFGYDGSTATFDIKYTTTGSGPVTVHVSVAEAGDSPVTQSYSLPPNELVSSIPISLADCTTSSTTLSISTSEASFDASSAPSTITVVCPPPPTS